MKDRAQRIRDAKGSSVAGASTPSTDPSDPRYRRSLAAAGASIQYDENHFRVNNAGRLALNLQRKPATCRTLLPLEISDASTAPDPVDYGKTVAYALRNTGEEISWKWAIPPDLDRTQPLKLSLYWVTTAAGTPEAFDGSIIARPLEINGNLGGSATDSTYTWSGTSGAGGILREDTFTVPPSAALDEEYSLIFFSLTVGGLPSTDTIAVVALGLEYTTLHYHTHERTR